MPVCGLLLGVVPDVRVLREDRTSHRQRLSVHHECTRQAARRRARCTTLGAPRSAPRVRRPALGAPRSSPRARRPALGARTVRCRAPPRMCSRGAVRPLCCCWKEARRRRMSSDSILAPRHSTGAITSQQRVLGRRRGEAPRGGVEGRRRGGARGAARAKGGAKKGGRSGERRPRRYGGWCQLSVLGQTAQTRV